MPSAQTPAPSAPSVPLAELRVVPLPEQELVDHLSARVPGFRCVLWDMAGDPVGARADEIDVAVAPCFAGGWAGALPASPATDGLVDARVLSLLPGGALVVDVGRGRVVDTSALTEEVVSGRLRCALDVVEPEPLPGDHPLMRAPGAIRTPHTGGSCTSYRPRVRRLLPPQLECMAAGERPLFLQQEGRLEVPAAGREELPSGAPDVPCLTSWDTASED